MTARITGTGTDSCHWPLEEAVNPISILYCQADERTKMRGPKGVLIVDTYRGPQEEQVIAHRDLWSNGRLWEQS